jgi:hypothetical protein
VDDVAAVQAICDGLDEDKITALAGKWLARLPYPFTADDTAAGYRYELSVLQAEFSLTQTGMRITDPRVRALLAAICAFRLLPNGFTNRDLRYHLAPLLGLRPEAMTRGQITYDLRRLRVHGLIAKIPGTHRYLITPQGIRQALFLTRVTTRLLIPGLAELTDPTPRPPPGCKPRSAPTKLPSTTSSNRPDSQPEHPTTTPTTKTA